jgi:hypothetical protein
MSACPYLYLPAGPGKEWLYMGEQKFYIYVGNAHGRFEDTDRRGNPLANEDGTPKFKDFANMFVVTPCSTYESDDFHASGYKAEKLGCVSPDVWKDLNPGELVNLYFTDKKKVALATSLGDCISLEP